MLFSSPVFFVFFITYFVFHRYIPSAYRIYLIIVGSTIFYAYWNPLYIWLPYYLIVVAFFGTRWLDGAGDPRSRRLRLGATIGALLAPLLFFKYTDFVYARILGPLLGVDGVLLGLPLPLGVSFIVFTMIAFVVDSHRRVYAERPPFAEALGYALSALIAGPILRPHELLPQLARPRCTPSRIKLGVAVFTVGLVKKLVSPIRLRRLSPRSIRRRRICPSAPGTIGWRSTDSRFRSTATSAATPIWRSGRRCCSACGCRPISSARTAPRRSSISGATGIGRCRCGCGGISISRWAAIDSGSASRCAT
jgi:hypothetical protein